MLKYRLIAVFLFVSILSYSQHSFEIKGGQFVYDGKPVLIHSGEMHFARVPKQYWRHRLQMLKAMGLNAVATYVFWNYHNPAPGVWDFKTGNHDIAEFIRTAQQEGMMVILRPGPYACAEWEFGGYPWWLQKNKDLVIRANNKPFLDSCKVYINKLAEQVKELQVTKGGPVIMIQAENEFGSYVSQRKDIPLEEHKKYNQAILQLLKDAGFDVPFFTSDGSWLFEGGSLPGVLPTANGEGDVDNLKKAVNRFHNNEGPYMVAEYYPGWLHHWGEKFPHISAQSVTRQLEKYLQNDVSFNIYMAHGGTNFGFTSGANYDNDHDIQPDLTTYDYDAPISEAGWPTPKYMAIRELMKKYCKYEIPEIPDSIPVITIPPIVFKSGAEILSVAKCCNVVNADTVLSFEDLNQGDGYVVYTKKFPRAVKGTLEVKGLRDYATVYINSKRVGVLNRIDKQYSLEINIPAKGTLDIFVEDLGRINYGAKITENEKGIISPVRINGQDVTGNWKMYQAPSGHFFSSWKGRGIAVDRLPAIYSTTFNLEAVGDIFLDMRDWGKGFVTINGINIGRYWNIGPQQTLYVPGAFLKKGVNDITVFDQLNDNIKRAVPTVSKPVLTELKTQIK